ncbi:RraA family protein [Methanobrevibacter olleyae]|uniref:3-hexulose-6-phosphate synthase n=1 Tax=Methanobrevibacter olleyae TaxID=294671 RepID=A0A126QXM4_METOL|nr:RraA family protein [Methanobrevibacter olleyae]AMK14913.1 demethylmenaquinone methyltransferase [Methanobrevibacter olleyae]SFL43796.1 3-hexulose-6-phosphate synthase [Methanobrevibacter olleyae]
MTKGKISPKNLLKKSPKVIDLDDVDITNYNFSIEDLNDKNSKNYALLKKILDSSSACQLSDAYSSISSRSGVIRGLKAMNNNKVYGKVFTAKTNTDDWGTSLMAMDNAEEGEVLFIYTYGRPASVWGELASTCASEKRIAGTILYGYTRDMDALLDLDYPVFALDYLPNAGKALGLGEINIDLEIGEDIIKPGDFVFGDQNGVVVIPKELFNETIVATFNVKVGENHIIKELKKGRLLSEIIDLNR